MIDGNEQVTLNFTLGEFFKSDKAKELGIDLLNPPEDILQNVKTKSIPKAQEAREIWGVPVTIVNCWRPLELNRAIGSKDTSAHVSGLGIDQIPHGLSLDEAFDMLVKHPTYMEDVDQLIIERGCIHTGLVVPLYHSSPRHELRKEAIVNGVRTYPLLSIWRK